MRSVLIKIIFPVFVYHSELIMAGLRFYSCLVVKQGWMALAVQVVMTWSTLELLKMMVS